MDPFHARLARVCLDAAARYGFCLAGGYAVQAHGFVQRQSEDVDLFTTAAIDDEFPAAVRAVLDALHFNGLEATVSREGPTFARIEISESSTG
ncbi:nucleotidyl transferase AbiEii/AbiGii toxin family protein [Actinopolymorpha sp. B11F2]|uniref:nucleotidyl transferase AbiEii/AbiGii toxin family protein n=1 Tax=Actinopolymorpha sp. B11F2 TaxID=3160862 RepID=UPI0032E53043